MKSDSRLMRYKERAKKARSMARLTLLTIFLAIGASLWMDDNIGPKIEQEVNAAVDRYKAASSEQPGAKGTMSAVLAMLNR